MPPRLHHLASAGRADNIPPPERSLRRSGGSNWIKTSFETQYKDFKETVGSSTQPLGYLFLEKVFQVSTPLPAISARTRAVYWDSLLKSPAGAAAQADVSQPSSPQPSEQAVEREREIIRSQTDNLTHAVAEDILKKKDTS